MPPRLTSDDLRLAIQGVEALKAQTILEFDTRLARLHALANGHTATTATKLQRAWTLTSQTHAPRTDGRVPLREHLLAILKTSPEGATSRELSQQTGVRSLKVVAMTLRPLIATGAVIFTRATKHWQLPSPTAPAPPTTRAAGSSRRSHAVEARTLAAIESGAHRWGTIKDAVFPGTRGKKDDGSLGTALQALIRAGTIRKRADKSYRLAKTTR